MRLAPRRRVILACLLCAVAGYFALPIFHGAHYAVSCQSAPARHWDLCGGGDGFRPVVRVLIWALIAVGVVALGVVLARWALRPVSSLTRTVRRLGPQNLGERSLVSYRKDETGKLAAALDEMMDRIAAGYEGQRHFAANASHELRTPLAVQRTLIEVSMANERSPEQMALLADQLLATNERNERLIEGLLALSESDRGLASRTPQRLDEIVAGVVDVHGAMAAGLDVTLVADLQERSVPGEQILLERLVTNLVRNAIAYNHENGQVAVTVGEEPALVVDNTGDPIAAESVAGLFEPFRRGTADRTHHGGGAGLGLTIVRSICQAHGGTVAARPGDRGGLRVQIYLPTAP